MSRRRGKVKSVGGPVSYTILETEMSHNQEFAKMDVETRMLAAQVLVACAAIGKWPKVRSEAPGWLSRLATEYLGVIVPPEMVGGMDAVQLTEILNALKTEGYPTKEGKFKLGGDEDETAIETDEAPRPRHGRKTTKAHAHAATHAARRHRATRATSHAAATHAADEAREDAREQARAAATGAGQPPRRVPTKPDGA